MNDRPRVRGAGHLEDAFENLHALAHPEQAEAVVSRLGIEAYTVVPNPERNRNARLTRKREDRLLVILPERAMLLLRQV